MAGDQDRAKQIAGSMTRSEQRSFLIHLAATADLVDSTAPTVL